MERKIQITEDGSATIYIPAMDETYHSRHGAIQEARHVFLKHGIASVSSNSVTVFELGFGTGLNALLTYQFGEKKHSIDYLCIEAYPVEKQLIDSLNYLDEVGEEYGSIFGRMHTSKWGESVALSDRFTFTKIHEKIASYVPKKDSIDIVYFDAFGPRAQGAMWELSVLEKMYLMLRPGGILVTYCAMGQFKRDLKSLGFTVIGKPGPPGKREMTVAVKTI